MATIISGESFVFFPRTNAVLHKFLFNKFGIWFNLLHFYSISHGNPEKKKVEKNLQFGNENKNNKVANFFDKLLKE